MKSRLTITLSSEILKKVDRIIDGKNIRNRSHAIEHLIRKSIEPMVDTAVILAGGKPKTKTPPPLIRIHQRHLLSLMIDHLKKFGVTKLIICAGPFEKRIKREFNSGSTIGVTINYVSETQLLGTAGAIKRAKEYLKDNPFLVVHGDVLTDLNLNDFVRVHQDENSLATIGVKPRIAEKKYGKVLLQGNKITDFLAQEGERGISIVNTGVYLFEPEVLNMIPRKTPSSLERDVFPRLAKMGELSAFLFQGVWFDVSRAKDRQQAAKRWKKEKR